MIREGPGELPGDPKIIEKSFRECPGAPRGLPLKKRVCGLSFFSTSEAPGERFLDPGRDPKTAQNRALERKVALRDAFFIEFCRFSRFSRFLPQFCIDFGRKIDEFFIVFFQFAYRFLQHGDPHETLYFTIRKLLFHFSRFCVFVSKTIQKSLKK